MAELALVIPVLVSSERKVVQTTSGRLSPEEIWVHCLVPPRLRARASMALQLPDDSRPEVVVGEVTETTRQDPAAPQPGFRARFIDLTPFAKRRIEAAVEQVVEHHRAFPRLPARLKVMAGATAFSARNISAVGMFVEELAGAAPGQSLDVWLDFGNGGPAAVKALVIHALQDGAGMQFVDSSREFRLRLDKYVASLGEPRA
jgi:hypothetical protein